MRSGWVKETCGVAFSMDVCARCELYGLPALKRDRRENEPSLSFSRSVQIATFLAWLRVLEHLLGPLLRGGWKKLAAAFIFQCQH